MYAPTEGPHTHRDKMLIAIRALRRRRSHVRQSCIRLRIILQTTLIFHFLTAFGVDHTFTISFQASQHPMSNVQAYETVGLHDCVTSLLSTKQPDSHFTVQQSLQRLCPNKI